MQIAERMSRLGTETAFEVLAKVCALKDKGIDVVSFCIGEPDFDTPLNIKKAAVKALMEDSCTHYCPSAGTNDFRQTCADYISETRNIKVFPENVVVCPGAKPIIFFSMFACINEGDEVIYPNPGYPIYESMINFVGAKPVPLPLVEEKEFSFDINDLKNLITPKTKMLILNSPQNPTGGMISKEDLEEVAKLVKEHDLMVLSDEVYSKILYDGKFNSIISFPGMRERTILIEGHSKTYAMTGWRLGYGVMPKSLAALQAKLMTNSNSCTAAFTQVAGKEAYEGQQQETDEMIEEFKARRDLVVEGLNNIEGVKCLNPGGAFYVFPNITKVCKNLGLKNAEQLADYLLYKGHVAVLARTCFGKRNIGETEEYIRLSYATSRENIKKGLKMLEKAMTDKTMAQEWLEEQD